MNQDVDDDAVGTFVDTCLNSMADASAGAWQELTAASTTSTASQRTEPMGRIQLQDLEDDLRNFSANAEAVAQGMGKVLGTTLTAGHWASRFSSSGRTVLRVDDFDLGSPVEEAYGVVLTVPSGTFSLTVPKGAFRSSLFNGTEAMVSTVFFEDNIFAWRGFGE